MCNGDPLAAAAHVGCNACTTAARIDSTHRQFGLVGRDALCPGKLIVVKHLPEMKMKGTKLVNGGDWEIEQR
jgi:hypothetical protein